MYFTELGRNLCHNLSISVWVWDSKAEKPDELDLKITSFDQHQAHLLILFWFFVKRYLHEQTTKLCSSRRLHWQKYQRSKVKVVDPVPKLGCPTPFQVILEAFAWGWQINREPAGDWYTCVTATRDYRRPVTHKTALGACLCLLGGLQQFEMCQCMWVLVCSWQLHKRSLMLQNTQVALEPTVIATDPSPMDGGWPNCSGTAEFINSGLHQPLQKFRCWAHVQAPNVP